MCFIFCFLKISAEFTRITAVSLQQQHSKLIELIRSRKREYLDHTTSSECIYLLNHQNQGM